MAWVRENELTKLALGMSPGQSMLFLMAGDAITVQAGEMVNGQRHVVSRTMRLSTIRAAVGLDVVTELAKKAFEELGKSLRGDGYRWWKRRTAKGLTLDQVGLATKLDPGLIDKIERGQASPVLMDELWEELELLYA